MIVTEFRDCRNKIQARRSRLQTKPEHWLYNLPMPSAKFYVVWKGRKRGIFTSWPECERQVKGFVDAEYKAFTSMTEAQAALRAGYANHRGRAATQGKWKLMDVGPRVPSICVDAACSGSPGPLEFRAVDTESGRQLFRAGPFAEGTNNVGEFLAIVEGLRWLRLHQQSQPITPIRKMRSDGSGRVLAARN